MTLIPDLQRDLIDAAARGRVSRRRVRSALGVALTALAAGVAIAALAVWRSDDPASPGGPDRSANPNPTPDAPPPMRPKPIAGTLSKPTVFGFDGVRYSMVGFRARGGARSRGNEVCVQLFREDGDSRYYRQSVTCAGERSLRRGLKADPVLNVGFGGGSPYTGAGFTRAGTSRVAVTGTRRPSRVALSDPWRPIDGMRIRAFVAVVAQPSGGGQVSRRALLRIRVVAAP